MFLIDKIATFDGLLNTCTISNKNVNTYITCKISGYNLQTYHTLVKPRPGTVKFLPI